MTFFHCSANQYPPGLFIGAGNWGDRIAQDGWLHQQAHKEAHLESERLLIAPLAPSRLKSVFFLPRISDAVALQSQRVKDRIYEVQPTSPLLFISDMALSRPVGDFSPHWPNRYWVSGFLIEISELVQDRKPLDNPSLDGFWLASDQEREELQELIPVQLRAAYHAVSPDMRERYGIEGARKPSEWGAPEILSTAPITVIRATDHV